MLKAIFETMRPKQWAKNGFLFAGLFFDRQLFNPPAFGKVALGFLVFSLLASTIYILNDLSDIEADKQHPKKKNRPLPSGRLAVSTARILVVIFLAVALPSAYLLNFNFFILAVVYIVANYVYTQTFKHIAILDVLLLAGFYVLRVGAGVTLIEVERFSPWLYMFTTFLALYLGIGKRRAELSMMAGDAGNTRKVLEGYTLPFLDQMNIIVSAMTIMTYSLYTFTAPNMPENHAMMFTIPFLIYGIFRYLYLVQVQGSGDAPTEVLFEDRPLQIAIILFGFAVLGIFYLFQS